MCIPSSDVSILYKRQHRVEALLLGYCIAVGADLLEDTQEFVELRTFFIKGRKKL